MIYMINGLTMIRGISINPKIKKILVQTMVERRKKMRIRKEYTCPLEIVHDILKGKWKTVILWQIKIRERASLSELEADIKGISQKMLLEQLRELREFGLIDKINYEGYPLRVEYFLTEERGKKIIKALELMQEFGKEYINECKKSDK